MRVCLRKIRTLVDRRTGALGEDRTPDPQFTKLLLYQLSYKRLVDRTGIEPATSCVQGKRSPN